MEVERFLSRHQVLWHVTTLGAWESIADDGLRTAAQLIAASDLPDDEKSALAQTPREEPVSLTVEGVPVVLRDQGRLLARKDASASAGDAVLEPWVRLLNQRVYFFATRREMEPMLEKSLADGGHDVLQVMTRRLVDDVGLRLELASQNAGAIARTASAQKLGDTFRTVRRFDDRKPAREVTVVDGVRDVRPLVHRVTRFFPDGSSEELL